VTQLLGDKLTAAMVAKERETARRTEYMRRWRANMAPDAKARYRRRMTEYQGQSRIRQLQNWADKGADLDIDVIRQIDRTRFGGILPPDIPARPGDGWIQPQSLWECPSATRHARLCSCDAWTNGPVSPDRLAL